jgi:acetyltransferase-like isoleucine patch superfamily enzyme
MDWLTLRRWRQVIKYGWQDAAQISKETGMSRLSAFRDIISAFSKWNIYSNQYRTNKVWEIPYGEREEKLAPIRAENIRRDKWVRENYHNWKFIKKWTQLKYEMSPTMQQKRKRAYTKEFNAGDGLIVQFNVHIHREHYLDGTIKIGKKVLLAKNVFIDYSGFLEIKDNVSLSDGVVIETHSHVSSGMTLKGQGKLAQTHLVIEEGVSVGSKAIIMDTCNKIGRNARVGAGAVVRTNVPPYAIVIGNPAKVVGFVLTPEEVEKNEMDYPEEERISIDKFTKYYNKYFRERTKENNKFIKL